MDSTSTYGAHYQSDLALDTNGIPHIVFNKDDFSKLVFARRINNSAWSKELVDSGSFYARPSFVFDKDNIPHCSYYELVGQNAYLCHVYKDGTEWHKVIIDTILGILTPYWFMFEYFRTAIDVDTFGNPGIAYTSFNPADSVFFIKYAHFDGLSWNISVVEYDTGCGSINQPSDQFPDLKFNSQNIPHIAFHHIVGQTDTIKLAYWDDSLGRWLKDNVYNHSYGCACVVLAMNNQDEPYIAHGVDVGLYCSYRNNGVWYHDYTGIDIGWLNTTFSLALDSLSNSHIIYTVMASAPRYCFRDTIWHDAGSLDTLNSWVYRLVIDRYGRLHLVYVWTGPGFHIRYARGTFVGIEENDTGYRMHEKGLKMDILPNISYGVLNIEYILKNKGEAEIIIYDAIGTRKKSTRLANCLPGHYKNKLSLDDLASGVYFVVLKQNENQASRKFLIAK